MHGLGGPTCAKCGERIAALGSDWCYVCRAAAALEAVDHPSHYGGKDDPFETIKVLEAWLPRLPLDSIQGALMFNVIKYLSRAGVKGNLLTDLRKAGWYLNRLIANLEKKS